MARLSVIGAYTDRSGTITTGGQAQCLMPANEYRKGFLLQNLSAGDLWFTSIGDAVASQPSFRIAAGVYYEPPFSGVPRTAISILGANTGQAFSAREW